MTIEEQRTSREISNANLIPFEPGKSGNPGGKPAGRSITAELRKLIDEGTVAEDIAKILVALCKRMGPDQVRALRELMDRTDGKVATIIATPDSEGRPSKIEIVIVRNEEVKKDD